MFAFAVIGFFLGLFSTLISSKAQGRLNYLEIVIAYLIFSLVIFPMPFVVNKVPFTAENILHIISMLGGVFLGGTIGWATQPLVTKKS